MWPAPDGKHTFSWRRWCGQCRKARRLDRSRRALHAWAAGAAARLLVSPCGRPARVRYLVIPAPLLPLLEGAHSGFGGTIKSLRRLLDFFRDGDPRRGRDRGRRGGAGLGGDIGRGLNVGRGLDRGLVVDVPLATEQG